MDDITERLRLLLLEAYQRRTVIIGAFAAIALIAAVVGLSWHKSYTSSTSVYVEAQSVAEPLLRGAAVQSQLTDRAEFAKETIYGRQFLMKLVEREHLIPEGTSPGAVDEIVDSLRDRVVVTTFGENMIQIQYSDRDPQRAMAVTQDIAALFIDESLADKARESTSAFNFIDQQVKEYEAKLKRVDLALKEYRGNNEDARAGAEEESSQRLIALRAQRLELEQQLREAEVRRDSLESQLSGETDTTTPVSRAAQYRSRIAELRSQLDSLRLNYYDSHPDVVRIKSQIAELERAAQAAESGKGGREMVVSGGEPMSADPLFQRLRGDLYDTRTTIRTLEARLTDVDKMLKQESARSHRIQNAAAGLSQLLRDKDVNTAIYQDLLRRREAARVSMDLEKTRQGLGMRVEEPAFLPTRPTGPRLLYFLAGGLALGVVLPLGTLFGIQQLDPRIRQRATLNDRLGLPVLGVVPHMHSPHEARAEIRSILLLGLAATFTLVIIGGLGAIRILGGV